MPDELPWTLIGFTDRFMAWVALETIDERVQRTVTAWIDTLAIDPYHAAMPEPRVEGLWWVKIPGTLHKGDHVAICSYWIDPVKREVRCDNFGSASWTV